MSIVAKDMRVKHQMAVFSTQWGRFDNPEGLISTKEQQFRTHGGEVETSLMLHFRPDLVRTENAQNFQSGRSG